MNYEALKNMSLNELTKLLVQNNNNYGDNLNDYMELSKAFAYANYNNHLKECKNVLFL